MACLKQSIARNFSLETDFNNSIRIVFKEERERKERGEREGRERETRREREGEREGEGGIVRYYPRKESMKQK